jgi:hypothetical protein
MSTYRAVLRLTPTNLAPWGFRALDSQTLVESLPGTVAHQLTTTEWGEVGLDVTLNRSDHEAALNDLLVLAQQFGYTLINGEISKFVGSEVEGAILSALGGGALGATSNNGWVALLAAAAAAAAGWLVGSTMKRVEVVYEVRPNLHGGWTFSPKAQPGGQAQPGPAWA